MENTQKTILIVEDDEGLQSQLKWHFDDFDTTIALASNAQEAEAAVRLYEPSIVIHDLGLPPDSEGVAEGFKSIQRIMSIAPHCKIIVLTGKNDHRNALKSIELGAFDFYTKPIEPSQLDYAINQALRLSALESELKSANIQTDALPGLVTANTHMQNICRMVKKIAKTNVTTTILGESGTGKEVIAQAIHLESDEKNQPFVAINCAAVPENLMESELFGHEKGAFTGATKTTVGKVEQANGGTLFLDEIGDMPLALQAKLLRFLQSRKIEKVGGRQEIAVDLRVVCATNKNLETMVKEGSFREDLYYRLCEIVVELPPLRERGGDALLIADRLLKKYQSSSHFKNLVFTEDAVQAISDYPWPGNIRELENKIKRACVLSDSKMISEVDLGLTLEHSKPTNLNLKAARRQAEIEAIETALRLNSQNVSAAAKMLGITRPTLYDLMRKYSLNAEAQT